eukprot:353082-Chlamydomonas_euryale.AAC.12
MPPHQSVRATRIGPTRSTPVLSTLHQGRCDYRLDNWLIGFHEKSTAADHSSRLNLLSSLPAAALPSQCQTNWHEPGAGAWRPAQVQPILVSGTARLTSGSHQVVQSDSRSASPSSAHHRQGGIAHIATVEGVASAAALPPKVCCHQAAQVGLDSVRAAAAHTAASLHSVMRDSSQERVASEADADSPPAQLLQLGNDELDPSGIVPPSAWHAGVAGCVHVMTWLSRRIAAHAAANAHAGVVYGCAGRRVVCWRARPPPLRVVMLIVLVDDAGGKRKHAVTQQRQLMLPGDGAVGPAHPLVARHDGVGHAHAERSKRRETQPPTRGLINAQAHKQRRGATGRGGGSGAAAAAACRFKAQSGCIAVAAAPAPVLVNTFRIATAAASAAAAACIKAKKLPRGCAHEARDGARDRLERGTQQAADAPHCAAPHNERQLRLRVCTRDAKVWRHQRHVRCRPHPRDCAGGGVKQ